MTRSRSLLIAWGVVVLSSSVEAQVRLVADLTPPTASGSSPRNFVVFKSRVYFTATTTLEGTEPWVSDGTTAGTSMLVDSTEGTWGMSGGFIHTASTLFFVSGDPTNGWRVWASDGTAAHTQPLTERTTGAIVLLAASDTRAWFATRVGQTSLLWQTDGTAEGTRAVDPLGFSGNLQSAIFNGDDLYVTASDAPNSLLLRVSASTGDVSTVSSSALTLHTAFRGAVFFNATTPANGTELWKTDGTLAGTSLVKDINTTGDSSPTNLTPFGNYLYFAAADQGSNIELWRTDGTTAGTTLFRELAAGTTASYPHDFIEFSGQLYFVASTPATGTDLFRTDGTNVVARELAAGATGSYPSILGATAQYLFVVAEDSMTRPRLWRIDTAGVATPVRPDLLMQNFGHSVVSGPLVYFSAFDDSSGYEVWASDGTSSSTRQVKNVEPDVGSSQISALVSTPRGLRFTLGGVYSQLDSTGVTPLVNLARTPSGYVSLADKELYVTDSSSETNLYVTNGTDAGTQLLSVLHSRRPNLQPFRDGGVYRDNDVLWLNRGEPSSTPIIPSGLGLRNDVVASASNLLFFLAGTPFTEVWCTEGTPATTRRLTDFTHQQPFLNATHLVADGNTVYVFARGLQGQRLYRTDGTTAGTRKVSDLPPGLSDTPPAVGHEGRLYFAWVEGAVTRVWSSDGTEAGTQPAFVADGPINWLFSVGHALLFDQLKHDVGTELFTWYPELTAPALISDIETGASGSFPSRPVAHQGSLYFMASTRTIGRELYSLKVDTTPPTVTPVITGTLGDAGIYVSDVSVAFTITEGESVATTCETTQITTDTTGQTLTCRAASMGGSAMASVMVKRDTAAPTLVCGPRAYLPPDAGFEGAAFATDAFDPSPRISTQPAAGTVLAPGTTTVTVTAQDEAGNSSTCQYDVEVGAPVDAECVHTSQCATGLVCLDGQCQSPPKSGCGCTSVDVVSIGAALTLFVRRRRQHSQCSGH